MDIRIVKIGENSQDYIEIGCHKTDENINEIVSFIKSRQGAVEGTKNAVENFNLGNKLTNAKNFLFDTGSKILENKQISSFLNFFKANNKEEPIENQ